MPKAFLLTNKRYDLYNLNIPISWRQQPQLRKEDADNNNDKANTQIHGLPDSSITRNCRQTLTHLQDVEIQPVNEYYRSNPSSENYEEEEIEEEPQPVNLSLKKLDLFNLRQLAEVSISIVPYSTSSTFYKHNDDASSRSTVYDANATEIMENDTDESYNPESTCSSSNDSITSNGNNSMAGARTNGSNHLHSCAECGKGYSTLSNLLRHRQTHRSTADSNAVKTCPYCDKIYVSMPAFSMHLRTHNQGCKCPYCGKLFSRPWLLQGHIRTHTGEKPFECPSCNKKFADKSNLRAHTQTHSTDKPYTCSRCSKKFGLKSYLSKHIESSCMKAAVTNTGNGASPNGSKGSKSRKRLQNNLKAAAPSAIRVELDKNYKLMAARTRTMSSSSSPTSSIGSSG